MTSKNNSATPFSTSPLPAAVFKDFRVYKTGKEIRDLVTLLLNANELSSKLTPSDIHFLKIISESTNPTDTYELNLEQMEMLLGLRD